MKIQRNETALVQFLENVVPSLKEPIAAKKIIVEKIQINIENLPESFNHFKICHLSDIHNTDIFQNNQELFDKLFGEKFDVMVISGDLIHDDRFEKSLATIEKIESVFPSKNIYISAGNHDLVDYKNEKFQDTAKIQEVFVKNGIDYLRNEHKVITKNTDRINIIGLDDPELQINENEFVDNELKRITQNIPKNEIKILISHRPEKIKLYAKHKIDLVFAGHAHGGQVSILKRQGIIAPNQGFFPKYSNGLYKYDQTQMLVSPGVSNSYSVPRINNPGKIYIVELVKSD